MNTDNQLKQLENAIRQHAQDNHLQAAQQQRHKILVFF